MNFKKRLEALEQRTNILTFEKDGEIGFLGKGLIVSYNGFIKLKEENEKLKNQIKEIKQYIPKVGEPSNYVSIDTYENIKEENKKLKNQVKELKEFLDKFVTKSNGLSMLFRATWRPAELQKRIKDLYELQCDVEEYWENEK